MSKDFKDYMLSILLVSTILLIYGLVVTFLIFMPVYKLFNFFYFSINLNILIASFLAIFCYMIISAIFIIMFVSLMDYLFPNSRRYRD